jgi:hypothetical protein
MHFTDNILRVGAKETSTGRWSRSTKLLRTRKLEKPRLGQGFSNSFETCRNPGLNPHKGRGEAQM